jgi:heme oxygenase (biliverdin-IX-beta and delta-forming)
MLHPWDGMARLAEHLRIETSEWHASIECALPLGEQRLPIDSYRRILKAFLGFYDPFETQLNRLALRIPNAIPVQGRYKVPWLRSDLRALGLCEGELAAIPRCPYLPSMECPTTALGCMYVTEGATLGGQVISRRLKEHLGLEPGNGASFFAGYGLSTGAMWRSFVARLDAELPPYQRFIAAAAETFDCFARWLRARGAPAWTT